MTKAQLQERVEELEAFISNNDEQTEAELNVIKADRDKWRAEVARLTDLADARAETISAMADYEAEQQAQVARLRDIIEKLLDAPYGTPDADDAREAARAELRGKGE